MQEVHLTVDQCEEFRNCIAETGQPNDAACLGETQNI